MTMPGQSRGQVSWVDEGRGALPRPRRSTSPRLNCPWSSRGRSANAYCRRPVWTRRIPRLSVGGVYGEMTMARLAWFLVLVGSLFALCGCGGRSNTTTPGDGGTDATTGDASAGCKTNADCANSADGALCNTLTHACGCNAASDCVSASSGNECQVPNATAGTVEKRCGCEATSNCPAGSVCLAQGSPSSNSARCEKRCSKNSDCSASATGSVCDVATGACVACNSNADCATSAGGPVCTSLHTCGCSTMADCASAAGGTQCLASFTGGHMAPFPGGSTSLPGGSTCGCNTKADCASGEVCRGLTPGVQCSKACTSNADCAGSPFGSACDTPTGLCVGCVTNSDCAASPGGKVCFRSRGGGGGGVGMFVPAPPIGTCSCTTKADCPSGEICLMTGSIPSLCQPACTSNSDCVGSTSGLACNTATGLCVEC